MKKTILPLFFLLCLCMLLAGCGTGSALSADHPVTLTMWHVYGEQADSPMNESINAFNQTVGKEHGVYIKVTALTNSTSIGDQLLAAQAGQAGAAQLPDLFTCHLSNAMALGPDALLDWNTVFSQEELGRLVPEFLADGMAEEQLLVFPVSKSTHLFLLSGSTFAPFAKATGADFADLATWQGFYDTAASYFQYSGGKAFCAMDYPLRAVELAALAQGAGELYSDGWYDFSNPQLRQAWLQFARAYVQGHVAVSDLYANTQVMTGDVVAGLGSSAGILYYNDQVTLPDNTTMPMDLQAVPVPKGDNGTALMTQAGVGLCALATTEQKAEAAALFARWLTEPERNLAFVKATGYMPVHSSAFDAIDDTPFVNQGYKNLYDALDTMQRTYTAVSEPAFPDYYQKVAQLYSQLRALQGASVDALAEETWQLFCSIV